jgi:hypothetical protein
LGTNLRPWAASQARFSPAAKSTYASAQRRGQASSGRSKPAVPSQSCHASSRNPDPHTPLLGAVDEEQAAGRPERLPAERPGALLLDEDHAPPRSGQLRRGDQARQPAAHHDRIGILAHSRQ